MLGFSQLALLYSMLLDGHVCSTSRHLCCTVQLALHQAILLLKLCFACGCCAAYCDIRRTSCRVVVGPGECAQHAMANQCIKCCCATAIECIRYSLPAMLSYADRAQFLQFLIAIIMCPMMVCIGMLSSRSVQRAPLLQPSQCQLA